jgi:DNA excision repair protein ERCC-3
LIDRNIPIVQEFDFIKSKESKDIEIEMNSDLKLRYYQERALRNVFIDDKARSGIIILPCGAGKSLVAVAIIQRIRKNAVIFCESQVSA